MFEMLRTKDSFLKAMNLVMLASVLMTLETIILIVFVFNGFTVTESNVFEIYGVFFIASFILVLFGLFKSGLAIKK